MTAGNHGQADLAGSPVRIHLTNVIGLGATQLVGSLLPALEDIPGYSIAEIFVPEKGGLASYRRRSRGPVPVILHRRWPNAGSRLLECFGSRFEGATPLLVLGDLPLRVSCRQVVLLQTPQLTADLRGSVPWRFRMKHRIARWVFGLNLRFVSALIVQTDVMKKSVIGYFPAVRDRIFVVPQPVPDWLLNVRGTRQRFTGTPRSLRLFYPSSADPHKNHRLLGALRTDDAARWPVQSIDLTIDAAGNPQPSLPWINCIGRQGPGGMLERYARCDALLFLSLAESWGFPLVEAMWLGLPILCPNLPYARFLCGDEAIYFDPNDIHSLARQVVELDQRLAAGWWPDWTLQLQRIPHDWREVAESILDIATGRRKFNGA